MVVSLVLDHLRCHILERAAEGVASLHGIRLHAPTKVADLNNVALFDENILRLDVAVNQPLFMHKVDS